MSVVLDKSKFVRTGDGLYKRGSSWRPMLESTDFVISAEGGLGAHEGVFRSRGKTSLGVSMAADLINTDAQGRFLSECNLRECSKFEQSVLVHGFYNGRKFVPPALLSFKYNNLFNRDLGPIVDSMGTVVIPLGYDQPIVEGTLDRAEDVLKKTDVTGLVNFAVGYSGDDVGVLGATCGFNYDTMEAIAEGSKEPLSDVLFGLATRTKETINFTRDFIIVVRLTVPPWPYFAQVGPDVPEIPINGISDDNINHLYLCDVHRNNGDWRVSLGSGVVLKAAARGQYLRTARRRVYRTLKNIDVPFKQYRTDIGQGMERRLRDLESRGLISGIQYEEG